MGDKAAYLYGEGEAGRRGVMPVGEGCLRGQAVEAIVKLDGGKVAGIEFQPLGLG